jgi:hypothetical protein
VKVRGFFILGLPMMRWLLFLLLQAVVADPSPPQKISYDKLFEPASIRALLESPDSKDQTWGAWLAGQGKVRDAASLLQRIVEKQITAANASTVNPPLDTALDALIQLEAKVPPAFILMIYKKRPAQALVLLSKFGSERNALLLDLGEHANGAELLAIVNMLIEHRTPGTAALLLKNLKIYSSLVLVDEGSQDPGEAMVGTPTFMIAGDPAAGHPPLAYYWLTDEPRRGDIVLALGPRSIFYQRVLSPPGVTPEVAMFGVNFDMKDRLRYISVLAGQDFQMPLNTEQLRSVIRRGKGSPDADIREFRQEIVRLYSMLVRALAERNLLTSEEATTLAEPMIKLDVRDLRTKQN